MPLFFSLRFYPGTELRKMAIDEGIIKENSVLFEDIFVWHTTTDNRLIRSACFLPSSLSQLLIKKLTNNPNSKIWESIIFVADILTRTTLMPITALRMIYRSQRRSMIGLIKVLPAFLRATHLPSIQSLRKYLFFGK